MSSSPFCRFWVPLTAAAALLGCGLFNQHDSRSCPQTYEFGNYGCAIVQGRVVGAQNQPLQSISVGPVGSADGERFGAAYVSTDGTGAFQVRLIQHLPSSSDSASVWIRATLIPTPAEGVATIFDSALVHLRIVPVGQIPDTAYLVITLPVP